MVCLIFGEEPLQKIEAIDAIRQRASQQGFDERITFTADASFDWNQLEQSFNSLSLFSNLKLIELTLENGKPGASGSKTLLSITSQTQNDTILLIHGGKIGQDVQKAKWFKQLEQLGVYIPCYPVEGHHFTKWLSARCQQYGVSLLPDAVKLLAEYSEGNLLFAKQEIEKLSLLNQQEVISAEWLEHTLLDQSRYTVFQMLDYALQGNTKKCISVLQRLKAEDIEPNIVLWALHKEVATLNGLHAALSQNKSLDVAFKQEGVWKNRIPLFKSALSRINAAHANALVCQLADLEVALKSFKLKHPFTAFAHICVSISLPTPNSSPLNHFINESL
ncbi:DNA polymerase III subunit delta [Flocculibacter collagenilyticus]|uniref:DNA polymerase III subunit delta n=1 Tax=Flocculibacter collagenilyticus TaxID=2744479 RepID=UPI0018F59C90|nr:DNA polymerase III subunit delta [Flocculibacter collagenilyticus]